MIGLLHYFNPGIEQLKNDITRGVLGKIRYITTTGCGNGPVRKDMSALWDFFPHDVSILLQTIGKMPNAVRAQGGSYLTKGIEDVVTMELYFPGGVFTTSLASWLHPQKKREVVVVGEKKYAVFDDYAQQDKLRYYDRKTQEETHPQLSAEQPLTRQVNHFKECILMKKKPITDAATAARVVTVLHYAHQSLKHNGKKIVIS